MCLLMSIFCAFIYYILQHMNSNILVLIIFEIRRLFLPHQKVINSEDQYGSCKARSVTTNLALYAHFLAEQMDKGRQADDIYTDFQKAFDKLNHKCLVGKMGAVDFTSAACKFFRSYLEGWRQYVRFKSVKSECFPATSGVPQESNLGPLLFS